MSVASLTMSWTDQGTSVRMDVLCLIIALLLHAPLLFVRLDLRKATVDRQRERLVAVDLIEPNAPKPVVAPAPKKEKSLFSKLKALVVKEPPPPPKPAPKMEPKKLDLAPKNIALDTKRLDTKISQPKLKTKVGFQTKAKSELVKEKQISLKNLGAGIAPLTEKKVGLVKDKGRMKQDKGNFQIARSETLTSIGGGPAVADPTAPTIAIRSGKKSSTEKFSAAPVAKSNKGKFGGSAVASLGQKEKLGLRDSIIARDAAPARIGGASPSLTPGKEMGSVGAKKDAGSFQAGVPSGLLGGAGAHVQKKAGPKIVPVRRVTPKRKKEMFTITGPLKDRTILKRVIPDYPSWAQTRGIEASVVLEFVVVPEGKVKNAIVVRRTSGYPRLDQSAISALRQWVFAPLAQDVNREEVGLITFNYTLN